MIACGWVTVSGEQDGHLVRVDEIPTSPWISSGERRASLLEVVRALRAARSDDRVGGVVIPLSGLSNPLRLSTSLVPVFL